MSFEAAPEDLNEVIDAAYRRSTQKTRTCPGYGTTTAMLRTCRTSSPMPKLRRRRRRRLVRGARWPAALSSGTTAPRPARTRSRSG